MYAVWPSPSGRGGFTGHIPVEFRDLSGLSSTSDSPRHCCIGVIGTVQQASSKDLNFKALKEKERLIESCSIIG